MRQELSSLTLPMINTSLTDFCKTHMKMQKTCCSFWELLHTKQQSTSGSTIRKSPKKKASGAKKALRILQG